MEASSWGLVALGAATVSELGYVVQTILDWVPEPALAGEIDAYPRNRRGPHRLMD